MSRSGPSFKKPIVPPTRCDACKGRGVTLGVFHELECFDCAGIGWLPMAGHDLTIQLGRMLSKMVAHNRVLQAQVPDTFGPEADYRPSRRDGVGGHYTGD